MKDYTDEEVEKALKEIEEMDQYTMCRMWRFNGGKDNIYFRNDYPTGKAFTDRLFGYFGGFTPEISKDLGWDK